MKGSGKEIFAFVTVLAFALPRSATAQVAICSDFNDATLQNWTTIAALANVSVQDPNLPDFYLHGGDLPSPPTSAIEAPSIYHGDLTTTLGLMPDGGCLEFDYIVFDEGVAGSSVDVCPHVELQDNTADAVNNPGIRAVFYCNPGMTVTESTGTNPGWHHYKLPLALTSGALPSNALGYWTISNPAFGGAAEWNSVLANVQRMFFLGDIAASPSQTESFGIDNVCFRSECDPVADPFPTAGGPTPAVSPVPFAEVTPEPVPCSVRKKLCVAKKATGLLACHRKAEIHGTTPNANCVYKVRSRFDGSLLVPPNPSKGCFEKAEAKLTATCLTFDDTAALEAKVDAFVDTVVTALDPGYPTPIQNACSAQKKDCVRKKVADLLKCHMIAEKHGVPLADPKIAKCLLKARSKLPGCFAKAELANVGTCLTTGDAAAIEAEVDAFVDDVVCALDPTGGTCPEPLP